MQYPARRGDETVAAFFLHAGQAAQEFIGHILAETDLAKFRAFDVEALAAQGSWPRRAARARLPHQVETGHEHVMDLAHVVIEAGYLEPVALRVDHAPPGEIVDRRSPQHGLLAAGVHRNVAADTGGVGGSGIDGEHDAGALRGFGDPLGDHAGAGQDAGDGARGVSHPRCGEAASSIVSTAPSESSFSVLMTADQGVNGTAPPV